MPLCKVLIIGAGPTGLMLACELARRQIDFRIIDKKPERTQTANAAGIQTRTLEIFDQLGILPSFLREGNFCESLQIHFQGKNLARVSMDQLDSNYPFIMALPQSETERLLNEYLEKLAHEVERPCELSELKQDKESVIATLTHSDGKQETVPCDYLVACDGANSKVRELCKIPFPGTDIQAPFMVANAKMNSALPTNQAQVFLDKGELFVSIPFKNNEYRIALNLPDQQENKPLNERAVKELIHQRSHGDYEVESLAWISPFWIHSKAVEQMRYQRIFLAGDAAHIHSPAGGQGMNTGLQDACNLAWKLDLVLRAQAKECLLDSYHPERYPVDSSIVKQTEFITKLILSKNPLIILLRNTFIRWASRQRWFVKRLTRRITQLSIRYKNSPIICYLTQVNRKAPQPGQRAPNVRLSPEHFLLDYCRNTLHNLLIFTGQANADTLAQIKDLQTWLNTQFSTRIKTQLVVTEKNATLEDYIEDLDKLAHHHYQIQKPTIYLIRPDNYIAYCSTDLSKKSIEDCLGQYLA